jgi:hypothetical protein
MIIPCSYWFLPGGSRTNEVCSGTVCRNVHTAVDQLQSVKVRVDRFWLVPLSMWPQPKNLVIICRLLFMRYFKLCILYLYPCLGAKPVRHLWNLCRENKPSCMNSSWLYPTEKRNREKAAPLFSWRHAVSSLSPSLFAWTRRTENQRRSRLLSVNGTIHEMQPSWRVSTPRLEIPSHSLLECVVFVHS